MDTMTWMISGTVPHIRHEQFIEFHLQLEIKLMIQHLTEILQYCFKILDLMVKSNSNSVDGINFCSPSGLPFTDLFTVDVCPKERL